MGTFLRFFDRSSAWLADDHILVAKRVFWTERYSRFYLADIQAVSICRTQTSLVWSILLGAATGLLALAGLLRGFHPAILVWTAIFGVPLAINLALGPSCICCVYTAVNVHRLSCFNRLSKAIVFLQTIKPLIAEVQGEVSDDEIAEKARLIPPLRRGAPGAPGPRKISHYEGGVHTALLVMMLLVAIASGLQMAAQNEFVGWTLVLLVMAQFGLAIAAASRQSGTDIPGGLRMVVWAAFSHSLVLPVLFVFAGVLSIRRGFSDEFSSLDLAFSVILLLSACVSGVLFAVGRHLLSTFRNDYRLKRMAARTRTQTQAQSQTFGTTEI